METKETREELIFAGALSRQAPAERTAYLDQACAGDAELRERIEALLRAHGRAVEFLNPASVQTGTLPDEASVTETPGTVIGRYKLVEKIGTGGFGDVWMAEQTEPVQRRVALKILKPGMDTREVVARFEAERQALALMDHPSIAKVLDGGATPTSRPYFAMELVRGIRITDYCEQNNLPTIEGLKLFMEACHAVQHAHQKGIIHRDLKPSNILVTVNDGKPVPKVIDFGIAKATEQRLTEKTLFTRFAQFLGTPAYMSPEQAAMTSLDIDTRSDIYSLGVLLYELLTGRTPFDTKELLEAGLDEMRRIIREKEPPTPSTRLTQERLAMRSVSPAKSAIRNPQSAIDKDLDWIVMKCLEKDRTRRYETANGLAADIRRHLDNEPVVAGPPSRIYRFKKMVRRNRGAFAAAAAVFLTLTAGIVGTTWMYFKASSAQRQSATDSAISKAVSEFLQDDLLRLADTREQAEREQEIKPDLSVREALDRAAKRIEGRFKNQPLVEAAIRLAIGDAYIGVGVQPLAVPHLERSVALRKAKLGPDHPETLTSMNSLALAYGKTEGRQPEAIPLLEHILKVRKANLPHTHADTLETMNNLARAYRYVHEARYAYQADPIALYKETLELRKDSLGAEHPDTLKSMYELAQTYRQMERSKALPLFEETFKLQKGTLGPDHPETLLTMLNVGTSLAEAGRVTEGLPVLEEALKRQLAILGPDHPQVLWTKEWLASAYMTAGRTTNGLAMYEETLKRRREKLGLDHYDTLHNIGALAARYRQVGRSSEAVPLYAELEQWQRTKLGADNPKTLRTMASLVEACLEAGLKTNALAILEEGVKRAKSKPGPEQWASLRDFGTAYHAAGRLTNAILLLEETLEAFTLNPGPVSSEALGTIYDLAQAHLDARQSSNAIAILDDGVKRAKIKLGTDQLVWLHNFAVAYQAAGRITNAIQVMEEKLTASKGMRSRDHPGTLLSMSSLAGFYTDAGRFSEALPLYEETLQLQQVKLGTNRSATLKTMGSLASAYRKAGRLTNAIALYEETLQLQQVKPGTKHQDTLRTMDELALAYRDARRFADAEAVYRKVLAQRRKTGPPDSMQLGSCLGSLSECLLQQGKYIDAEPLLRQGLAIHDKKAPTAWQTFNIRSRLGAALLGQKKYAEAEPLLVQGYQGMKQRRATIPKTHTPRLSDAATRLVQLYESWGQPAQADKWKRELAELNAAGTQ